MFLHSLIRPRNVAAVSALVVLSALGAFARAEEPLTNLGPVGPYEPILTAVGSKRVIAFYVPDRGRCAVSAVVWDSRYPDAEGSYGSTRVRTTLGPGKVLHVDAVGNAWIDFRCGENATNLAVAAAGGLIALGPATDAGR